MATGAKINIKNIDYFKFKKIVIDGNRDDYGGCSREVKSLCDSVQTLSFRDDEFDDVSDRARFDEIISSYRQILASKRIEPTDMRIKNGWWLDVNSGNVCSAGKFKPGALKETLVTKTKDWISRHGATADLRADNVVEKIEGPGLYVFKHKEHQCFQYVGKADKIFSRCAEKMKSSFDGTLNEPLAALLVISMASDWEFYFIPVQPNDGADILRILENDVILKHDCIWPHGLNFSLHIDSLLEVSEFRKSCLRHHWPPESDVVDEAEVSLDRLRRIEKTSPREPDEETGSGEATINGGAAKVDSKPQLEGSPTGKPPTENGHPSTSNGHPLTNAMQPPVLKTSAAPTTVRQPPGAAPARRIARPTSAPRPPAPKPSSNPTSRPKSPVLSNNTTRRLDAVHRSLDADDHRGPRAKSSGTATRRALERPRSSLDGRQEGRVNPLENQTTRKEEASKGGMTRSKSVSSTTSIDSKKEKTPVGSTERVKSTAAAAKESVAKASGIKAPAVQVTNRRRPPTAKPKATNAAETTQEDGSS